MDRVLTMGLQRDIANLLVDFGQDVRVHGHPEGRTTWHIGLEDPTKPGQCWTGVAVGNHAVATSGDYVRNFTVGGRRYGHIIDPAQRLSGQQWQPFGLDHCPALYAGRNYFHVCVYSWPQGRNGFN